MKYDVFISYRREGGSEFARSVKAELEHEGYSVFLDFDELKDGKFDQRILDAIEAAPVFIFILSPHSLDRCVNEDDWVRKEIEHAYGLGKHIIPVNKDGDFEGLPSDLPEPVASVFSTNQFSDIMVGQLFEASMKKMIDERVAPVIKHYGWLKVLLGVLVVLLLAGGLIMNRNSVAGRDLAEYDSLLCHADSLLYIEDSLNVASDYISAASAIEETYEDSNYSDRFGKRAELMGYRLERIQDSLFIVNKNYIDYYMSKYREEGGKENKQKALEYIDKALALKYDYDLSTMRRILK